MMRTLAAFRLRIPGKWGLAAFIASLADGYDTRIGERGMKLSGGQRQRLAMAKEDGLFAKLYALQFQTT